MTNNDTPDTKSVTLVLRVLPNSTTMIYFNSDIYRNRSGSFTARRNRSKVQWFSDRHISYNDDGSRSYIPL